MAKWNRSSRSDIAAVRQLGLGSASGAQGGDATLADAAFPTASQDSKTQPLELVKGVLGAPDFVGTGAPSPAVDLSVSALRPGQVVDWQVADIVENPVNARRIRRASAIDAMAKSLQENGQDTPAPAFISGAGRLTLIDGLTRLTAARAIGLATLRVEIREPPKSPVDLYLASRRLNAERSAQSPLDDAIAWGQLVDTKALTQAALAEVLGLSEAVVSKTLGIRALPESLMHQAADVTELAGLKPLYALAQFFSEAGTEETLKLIAEISQKGLSSRDIDGRRASRKAGKKSKPRSDRMFFTVGEVRGELRRFDSDGRLELRIRGLDEESLAGLERSLSELLTAQEVSATSIYGEPSQGAP